MFLIRQIAVGGAERQLVQLARRLPERRFDVTIVSMYDGAGPIWDDLEATSHVRHVSMGKTGRWDLLSFFRRLVEVARDVRPHVVHGYMIPANEIAVLAARAVNAKLVWGVRVSDQDPNAYSRFRRTVQRAGVQLSRFADLIIANSFAGRTSHVAAGYPPDHFIVIPNGIDVNKFVPDVGSGQRWRASVGIEPGATVVALPARMDPMKGHPVFLEAAARTIAALPEHRIRFVCAGDGPESYRSALRAAADRYGLGDRVLWTSAVSDVGGLYNASDVVVSASVFGEGFPNVLAEAMACGRPCVAAASGDARLVVGDAGVLVSARSADALSDGLIGLLALDAPARRALGARARARVAANFTIPQLVERSAAAFEAVVAGREVEDIAAPVS